MSMFNVNVTTASLYFALPLLCVEKPFIFYHTTCMCSQSYDLNIDFDFDQRDDVRLPRPVGQEDGPRCAHVRAPRGR